METSMGEIRLRPLLKKDAPLMLEWMHDPSIACYFRFDALKMTLSDCEAYIDKAQDEKDSVHFAIVDGNDEYLGTISLKNIDREKGEAEYAISSRKKVHGTGAAMAATEEILRIAFYELGLRRVYLNVLKENARANAFYKKAGFQFDYSEENAVKIHGERKDLNWYFMIR